MPDILHEILKGVFSAMLEWWHQMLKGRTAVNEYEVRCLSIPHYPGLHRFTKPINELRQSSGRDMREIMRVR